jgi:putative cell wall-binding protein
MKKSTNLLVVILVLVLISIQSKASLESHSSDEAYVTLLYGDEFLLGVRVLGKSIRDTGSRKDMVVLVSDGVSDYAKKLLQVLTLFACRENSSSES